MLSRADETDLVLPLHDGMHERPCWDTFLLRLRWRARATGAAILIGRISSKMDEDVAMSIFSSGDIDTSAILDPIRAGSIRPSRVYAGDNIDGVTIPLRIVRVDEREARCTAWMVVCRAKSEFGATESAVLAGLVPHAEIALRNWATMERLRSHAIAADAALARLGGGWVAINADGQIADIEHGAGEVLRTRFAMTQPIGERLPVAGRAASTLAAVLKMFATDRAAPPQRIELLNRPLLEMLAVPAPSGVTAVLLGCLRTRPARGPRAAIVAQLFGLSASEARLAVAMAEGATLTEAATAQSLTIETARNYSKRIYAKTGARGQTDVVRLILGSVAAFV